MVVLPVGDATVASARFRVLAHCPALGGAGFDPEVVWPLGQGRRPRRVWRAADLARDALGWPRASLVLVHRKMYPPLLVPALFRRRPFVLDMDDALDLPPPGAPATPRALARYRRNFLATARAARLVLCGSRELQNRVPPECTSAVLPTPVDCRLFSPERVQRPDGPVLGWVGHSDNFTYLEALREAFLALCRRFPGLSLLVVADRPPELPGVPVTFRPWSLSQEVTCFSGMSIGLMPLADTPWARSKCAFKLLQYMALGIPAVASPVGMNREVVRSGVDGLLASSPEEWIAALGALLSDAPRAVALGAAGRERVLREYDLPLISTRLVAHLRKVASSTNRPKAPAAGSHC